MSYRFSDIVTINNEINRQYLASIVPEKKIVYVPNPIVFPESNSKQEVRTRKKILLAVGRLTNQKGFDLLLNAYSRTKARHLGWTIEIVGEGPDRDILDEIISRKNLQRVVTLNPPELDLSSYFNSATVFVLPSRYEGTPNALLEAIGYGLIPIVSDNLGTISNQIADVDQNVLFKNGSICDLAKCIDNIVDLLVCDQYDLRRFDSVLEPYKQTNALEYWDRLITS
jgi:glycosyltransferase involved in cell wall biosynthesis